MAKKAKKPTPPQKNKTVGKSAKAAPVKKLVKPAQAAKPAKQTKSAKPNASAKKPTTQLKSVKSAAMAKSVKPLKPVKPTKSSKPIAKPVQKNATTKSSGLKSEPKTAVKKSTAVAPAKKTAVKPVPAPAPVPTAKKNAKSTAPAVFKNEKKVEKAVEVKTGSAPKAPSTKAQARDDLRTRILQKKGPARPIAFSLDEIREIAKTASKQEDELKATAANKVTTKTTKIIDASQLEKAAQPHHIKAASLADILGFNPKKKQVPVDETDSIPEKFRRYYKLLIELRNHLTGQIDTHSEETLKRSSKDDAGDLSSYGQHMADAGTDTFDRDFALSLVSSEQEALSEVEAAIQRIKDGSYGICENTQKPIAKERLVAVPFTRYSAEAQKDIEKNRMRSRTQAGLFGELGEEGATLSPGSGGDDGDE